LLGLFFLMPACQQTVVDENNAKTVSLPVFERVEDPFNPLAFGVPMIVAVFIFLLIMMQRPSQSNFSLFQRLLNVVNPPWPLLILVLICSAYGLGAVLVMQTPGDSSVEQVVKAVRWIMVLAPVVAVGLFYIGFMYFRDATSVHPAWAAFLGLLRASVYGVLSLVFLLPGCQQAVINERTSKVIVLFDVSGSMKEVDQVPDKNKPETLRSRQEKVLHFLGAPEVEWEEKGQGKSRLSFMAALLKRNPVTCYRFGRRVDPKPRTFTNTDDHEWTEAELRKELLDWLVIDPNRQGISPDQVKLEQDLLTGTDLGGAVRQVYEWEANNMLQSIILFSDGRSNVEEEKEAGRSKDVVYDELRDQLAKAKVPVICVGVGDFKPPIGIRINDVEAPTSARPDEPFPVIVPVVSQGLRGQKYQVILDIRRIKDRQGNPIKGEKYPIKPEDSFHKDGEADRTEFQIDVAKLKGIDAKDDKAGALEGTWEFQARVARDKREAFAKPFHISEPTRVRVLKKKMRVLIFSGGPGKEYQFLKTYFYREALEKRMEVGVFLQTNKNEEINLNENEPQEWILDHFPNMRVRGSGKDKPYTLFEYDLIIALDPDWSQLAPEQLKLIKEWVEDKAGGLVLVAGPVFTYQLRAIKEEARAADPLTPIRDILPVELQDDRVLGLGEGFNPTDPHPLKFPGAQKRFEFLKLNEKKEGLLAGWNNFFYDQDEPPGESTELVYGFYRYYPVLKPRSLASVIATFPARKGGVRVDEPWIATMKAGSGTTVFIGSLELWRLRQHNQDYHLRFWLMMARFAGMGNMGRLQKFGESNIPERMLVGDKKRVEYRLRGPDGQFLRREDAGRLGLKVVVKPYVKKIKVGGVDALVPLTTPGEGEEMVNPDKRTWEKPWYLKAKPGDRRDERSGWFIAEGDLKKPGKYQFEMEIKGTEETLRNTVIVEQPNPELDNVKPDHVRMFELASDNQLVMNRVSDDDVKKKLTSLKGPIEEGSDSKARDGVRLYFDLDTAGLIPLLLIADQETQETKGSVEEWRTWSLPRPFSDDEEWSVEVFGYQCKFATFLMVVVFLLSLEWLTRKLLRLA
jgi:hypothetical protein